MNGTATLAKLSPAERLYEIRRLNRQARSIRLEAARAAATLSSQLIALAASMETEAEQLESVAAN